MINLELALLGSSAVMCSPAAKQRSNFRSQPLAVDPCAMLKVSSWPKLTFLQTKKQNRRRCFHSPVAFILIAANASTARAGSRFDLVFTQPARWCGSSNQGRSMRPWICRWQQSRSACTAPWCSRQRQTRWHVGSDTAVYLLSSKRFSFTLPLGLPGVGPRCLPAPFAAPPFPLPAPDNHCDETASLQRLPSAALQDLSLHRSGRLHPQGAALLCG